MGNRKRTSVVNEGGKVWDTEGLYIADASVMPTATGVNPAITVSTFFFSFYHLQKKKRFAQVASCLFFGGGIQLCEKTMAVAHAIGQSIKKELRQQDLRGDTQEMSTSKL